MSATLADVGCDIDRLANCDSRASRPPAEAHTGHPEADPDRQPRPTRPRTSNIRAVQPPAYRLLELRRAYSAAMTITAEAKPNETSCGASGRPYENSRARAVAGVIT